MAVELNGVGVSDSSNLYPYRAFFETSLSADDEMTSRATTELICPDTEGKGKDGGDPSDAANDGLKLRYDYTGTGVTFQMRGRIHGDIFNSGRMIPQGVTVHIKLIPTTDQFRIISKTVVSTVAQTTDTLALAQEKVLIEDIYLIVQYTAHHMNNVLFSRGQHAR